MKNISKIVALCCVLPSMNGTAGTMGAEEVQYHWKPVIGVSVSPSWASGGETQTFFLQPDIEKTYTANKETSSFATGELFLGLQKNLSTNFIGQFGLAINATGNAGLSGDIWEDADPDFNNFTYNYKINHVGVALKGRIIGFAERFLQPYVSGSLGVGFNRAHDFLLPLKFSKKFLHQILELIPRQHLVIPLEPASKNHCRLIGKRGLVMSLLIGVAIIWLVHRASHSMKDCSSVISTFSNCNLP
ncbi:hypothetical protein Loa_02876 [Legionella oakridgensis ATCC 33761 = DSM 21215]|uniref:Uncharacterized protein n=1 Tax=Legionella oakridgensis ATCC 33761 = DSM 21215 TaxID=1268635 RepID=W0BJ17_9GAMM|nr:hypothetical protein [Legionella oakridgensis]AHE68404.1 hypothetical protein Loa_02876 [Legionella oakridgensis ATCC 33761 = DSM 21215]